MIYDKTTMFSDAQAITATAPSTNSINVGTTGTPQGARQLGRDLGKGADVPVAVTVGATFNNLTSLNIAVQCDGDINFGSPKTLVSRTYLLAELTAGKILPIPEVLPEGADEQYLRLLYTVTGTAPTTGNITAGVVAARQTNMGTHY